MEPVLVLIFISLISSLSSSYGYDPLDPNGNITIRWDLMKSTTAVNDVRVAIFNNQLYRHIDQPGWKLNWGWKGDEVIWDMRGAETTEQGNCSRFKEAQPHCCEQSPVVVDLMPGAPYNMQTANCCRGGVVSSLAQDRSKSLSGFQMSVGVATNGTGFEMPENFTLGVPGYSCGNAVEVLPSKFNVDGRRKTQALRTWNVTCVYSQFMASKSPKCCVSLSAFYNSKIAGCPKCSCHCQGAPNSNCIKYGQIPPLLEQMHDPNEERSPTVICTKHMCPIHVHWHIKESYTLYWRVKVSITNLNIMHNYSQWTLVALHPNFRNISQIFSFNYTGLDQNGYTNDTAMFWGIQYFNDMLSQAGDNGNVQSEILLQKDREGGFTFREGWGFPRRILFNGDECVMPLSDDYPRLPNSGHTASSPSAYRVFFTLLLLLILL